MKVSHTRINLQNTKKQIFIITDILYSAINPKAVILINNERLICLINTKAKICLIREEKTRELRLNYMADRCLKLIDVNGDETIMTGVYENMKISISPVIVI